METGITYKRKYSNVKPPAKSSCSSTLFTDCKYPRPVFLYLHYFAIRLQQMAPIRPFKIAVSKEKLDCLSKKLELADFLNDVDDDAPWLRGPPLADMKRLTAYWRNGFNWRATEAKLNQLPQYTTEVNIQDFGIYEIHFVHQPSEVKTAIPLLFAHGWPGSFIEVSKLLPQLNKGGQDFPAFHVVAPSLIDYGFSSPSKRKDFGIIQQAEAFHKVMVALGYDEYGLLNPPLLYGDQTTEHSHAIVVQGGDLGYLVSRSMALNYGPKHVKAHHLNNSAPAEPKENTHPELHAKCQSTPLSQGELAGLARTQTFNTEGNGYVRLQATKPLTAGYFMTDSPVGLLAWIFEKLHDWVDDYNWTDDEILTWVCIYYFSRAGPAATNYIYYAMDHVEGSGFADAQRYSGVPVGISRFPKDLILLPKLWNQTMGPVVYEREHQRGGHFAAWEQPDAIVEDLRCMFGRGGGAYNVVGRNSGYL